MKKWEKFEIEWQEFLSKTYGNLALFERRGGSDSTKSDIRVLTKNGKEFFIETKLCPAQCGQFVLFPNDTTKKFEYSKHNDKPINKFAEQIIDFMNKDFESFKNSGTKGKAIEFDGSEIVFVNWIMKTYGDEGVTIFASNNGLLVPIEEFPKFFDTTAKYRIKRSGSSVVKNNHIDEVLNYIQHYYQIKGYRKTEKGALFIKSPSNLNKQRFIVGDYEYMFSLREKEYEVRRLSNTYNSNVIFTIKLKDPALKGLSKEEFEKFLLNC